MMEGQLSPQVDFWLYRRVYFSMSRMDLQKVATTPMLSIAGAKHGEGEAYGDCYENGNPFLMRLNKDCLTVCESITLC